jgi:hypothetical protein
MMIMNTKDVRPAIHIEWVLNGISIVSKHIAGKNDALRRLVIHLEKKTDIAIFHVTPLIVLTFRN